MRRLALCLLAAPLLAATLASASAGTDDDRLLIVNGNTGHVVYDDGRNDLFCVTRRTVVGYDDWGHPVRQRTMRCR